MHGGTHIPADTRPENFRAMIDAVMKYGRLLHTVRRRSRRRLRPGIPNTLPVRTVTPWEVKRAELGEILGDETLIREPWERLERMAYNWLFGW